jgi:hypothetical protein
LVAVAREVERAVALIRIAAETDDAMEEIRHGPLPQT